MEDTQQSLLQSRTRQFAEFLGDDQGDANYPEQIRQMLNKNERRLIVSLDDLREFDREYWRGIMREPTQYLPAAEAALADAVKSLHDVARHASIAGESFFIGFKGSFGDFYLNPRTIRATHLGKMVCTEGIVTRCSLVRPKLIRSVHYCEDTKKFHARTYVDQTTSFDAVRASSTIPTQDEDGHHLSTEFGYCTFKDHQSISIQEMPEKAPAGQLPRSIDIVVDNDLVDFVKPGDRVQIVGIYRTLGGGGNSSSTFKAVLLANNIVMLSSKGDAGTIAASTISETDVRNFNLISKKPEVFDLLANSLAPSIYGFEHVKRAVLLMLLGGQEKNLANGTHIRGDINILMVGDPSTAKSQMLRFVLNTATLAIATTGRGSSGVGLTAAVTHDKETGERRLEAGAMVLADRGVVCIDEFDKMGDADRVAIHEVMEQQTVTIAKAGIHTTLNARCSVIAAANPIFGQYDKNKDPTKNIALPDSLLSRFDLLFVVTDDISETRDRTISEHVLRMHRYLPPGVEEGTPVREASSQLHNMTVSSKEVIREEEESEKVFEKFDELLHGGVHQANGDDGEPQVLAIPFVRKYIHYAKTRIHPQLRPEATEYIVKTYSALRNDDLASGQRRTSPITARTLETLIRLATAHAKARLSYTVDAEDAEAAESILRYALFKEVKEDTFKRRRVSPPPAEDSDVDSVFDEDLEGAIGDIDRMEVEDRARMALQDSDDEDNANNDEVYMPSAVTARQRAIERRREEEREISEAGPSSGSFVGNMPSSIPPILESQSQPLTESESLLEDIGLDEPETVPLTESSRAERQAAISNSRLAIFSEKAGQVMSSKLNDEGSIPVETLIKEINKEMQPEDQFSPIEAQAALSRMHDDEKIFISEGSVYSIV